MTNSQDLATRSEMTPNQHDAFDALVHAWKRRENARSQPFDLASLAAARRELDAARLEMALQRHG